MIAGMAKARIRRIEGDEDDGVTTEFGNGTVNEVMPYAAWSADGEQLPLVKLGDDAAARIGRWVVAISRQADPRTDRDGHTRRSSP